jgi:colanic acid biosynthesis protein WcaH
MKLPLERFKQVVRDTVLVSLELLIVNEKQEILVGRRRNAPAKGYLFVPGGRICKGENPGAALARITREEIGVELCAQDAILYGVYHHVHDENYFGEPEIGATEYVVIACLFSLDSSSAITPDTQHDGLHFIPISAIAHHPEIHELTKSYFVEHPANAFLRTKLAPLAARRELASGATVTARTNSET